MDKKIVAFDLDGTLTESKQPLSRPLAELLAKLSARLRVAVISGGSYTQFEKQFLPFLPVELVKNNLILLPTNGNQCYEFSDELGQWQMVDQTNFPPLIKEEVIRVLTEIISRPEFGVPVEAWGNQIEDRGTQVTFSALGQEAPLEEKRLWDPDQIKRQKIRAELVARLPEVEISIGGTTSLDFLPKGSNKAIGLGKLLDRSGLHKSDLVFVGDAVFPGGNDHSVLQAGIETIRVNGPEEAAAVIENWLN